MLRAFSVLALTTLVASLAWGLLAQRIYFLHTNREPAGWGSWCRGLRLKIRVARIAAKVAAAGWVVARQLGGAPGAGISSARRLARRPSGSREEEVNGRGRIQYPPGSRLWAGVTAGRYFGS